MTRSWPINNTFLRNANSNKNRLHDNSMADCVLNKYHFQPNYIFCFASCKLKKSRDGATRFNVGQLSRGLNSKEAQVYFEYQHYLLFLFKYFYYNGLIITLTIDLYKNAFYFQTECNIDKWGMNTISFELFI